MSCVQVQVGVAVMRLHDGKPHYAWLPLQKRTDRDSVSGEVHLRMQWISEELDTPADAALNLVVDMLLHGIGLSVVESSVKALPREVCLHRLSVVLLIMLLLCGTGGYVYIIMSRCVEHTCLPACMLVCVVCLFVCVCLCLSVGKWSTGIHRMSWSS